MGRSLLFLALAVVTFGAPTRSSRPASHATGAHRAIADDDDGNNDPPPPPPPDDDPPPPPPPPDDSSGD